jgi:hypothetical protein
MFDVEFSTSDRRSGGKSAQHPSERDHHLCIEAKQGTNVGTARGTLVLAREPAERADARRGDPGRQRAARVLTEVDQDRTRSASTSSQCRPMRGTPASTARSG